MKAIVKKIKFVPKLPICCMKLGCNLSTMISDKGGIEVD